MKRIFKPQILLSLLMLQWSIGVSAQDNQTQKQDIAELLKQVNIKTVDGREVADVPLKMVLQLAIDRSISLKALKLGSESAAKAVIAAEERNTPVWSNSLAYSKSPSMASSSSCGTNTLCGSRTDAQTLSSSYSKKTDSGISYSLTYSESNRVSTGLSMSDYGESVKEVGSAGSNFSSASLTSSVNIPLFQDFGSSFNQIPVKLAEVGVMRDQQNSRQTQLALLNQVATIYWNLAGVLKTVEVKKKALELSEKLLRDNQARHEAGMLSETEVRVTETQLMRDRQSLLSSRLDALRIEDQVRAALNLGELPVGLYPVDQPASQSISARPLAELLEKVYASDSQISSLNASLEQNKYELEQELNKQDSNMDLNLSYTMNGYSSNPLGGMSDFSKSDLHGLNATFTWNIPLGDQATSENIQRKKLARQQLQLQIEDRKSQLDVSIQSTLRSLELLEEERKTAEAMQELSHSQLRSEIERFKLGKSTSYRVSQYQQDVVMAEQQYILARINQEKANLELMVLTGDIIQNYELIIE